MLRNQLSMTFSQVPAIVQAKVSLDRINNFLRKVYDSANTPLVSVLRRFLLDRAPRRLRPCPGRGHHRFGCTKQLLADRYPQRFFHLVLRVHRNRHSQFLSAKIQPVDQGRSDLRTGKNQLDHWTHRLWKDFPFDGVARRATLHPFRTGLVV